jgi:hypothetical protein
MDDEVQGTYLRGPAGGPCTYHLQGMGTCILPRDWAPTPPALWVDGPPENSHCEGDGPALTLCPCTKRRPTQRRHFWVLDEVMVSSRRGPWYIC